MAQSLSKIPLERKHNSFFFSVSTLVFEEENFDGFKLDYIKVNSSNFEVVQVTVYHEAYGIRYTELPTFKVANFFYFFLNDYYCKLVPKKHNPQRPRQTPTAHNIQTFSQHELYNTQK
jgi:hypothetical protein